MHYILAVILMFSQFTWAESRYDEYETYETFTDLDRYQRDYGLTFTPSFIYTSVKESNEVTGSTVSDRNRTIFFYDIRLGYIFRGGFYFGLLYAGESQDINNALPENSRESLGLSFGFIRHGLSLTGTFFPYSKQSLENTSDISVYSEGMGYQLDVAYYFRVGRFASVGPQLVYKSLAYKKAERAATNVNSDASSQHNLLTPMVSMIINLYRG